MRGLLLASLGSPAFAKPSVQEAAQADQCSGWTSSASDAECRVQVAAAQSGESFQTLARRGEAEVVLVDNGEEVAWLGFVPAKAVTVVDEGARPRGAAALAAHGARVQDAPRVSGSAYGYVQYLVDRYEDLPRVVAFLHHHGRTRNVRNSSALHIRGPAVPSALAALGFGADFRYAGLTPAAQQCTCLDLASASQPSLLAELKGEWQAIYEREFGPESTLGDRWCLDCGAEFAVSRDAIRQHPRAFYRRLLERLLQADGAGRDGALQNFWSALFDLPRAFPDAVLVGAEAQRVLKSSHGFAQAPKPVAPSGVKLFCYMVVRPGREAGLLRAQSELGDGVTGCDAFRVYSNVTDLDGLAATAAIHGAMDRQSGRALFRAAHRYLFHHAPRPWHGMDWVVKLEPGTVFSAARLRRALPSARAPLYYASDAVGFRGLEVVSAAAMDVYAKGHAACEDIQGAQEDAFLDLCLHKLGVPSRSRADLEQAAVSNPRGCADTGKVAFKSDSREKYIECWHEMRQALDEGRPELRKEPVEKVRWAVKPAAKPAESDPASKLIAEQKRLFAKDIRHSREAAEEDEQLMLDEQHAAAMEPTRRHEHPGWQKGVHDHRPALRKH